MESPLQDEEAVFARAGLEIGQFNLGLFGPAGVGKSTLLNAVFGADLAATGIGRPITQKSDFYAAESSHLGIFDSKGLEVGTESKELLERLSKFIQSRRSKPLQDQLHVAWYCIAAHGRRFTAADAAFVRRLHELGVPVLIVITQAAAATDGPDADTSDLVASIVERDLPGIDGRIWLVNALRDDFDGTPQHGLEQLLEATRKAAPRGVQTALDAAQSLDMRRKSRAADKIIEGVIDRQNPLANKAADTWAEMVFGISHIYGVPPGTAIEVVHASPLYKRADRLHGTATNWFWLPIVGVLPFLGRAAILKETTRAIGYSWRDCCESVWQSPDKGWPSWNQHVMQGALEESLKERLPGIFTFDK
jgi:predicted GTPase